jgi:RNA polymerase sigma-70 factor (ECF subfamily)
MPLAAPTMPDCSRELEWLARARQGDLAAFDEIVRLHYTTVHSFLLRQTRQSAEAEDLAQETFVRAWKGLSGCDPTRSIRAWLTRIAWNLHVDHERVRSRRGDLLHLAALDSERSGSAVPEPAARADFDPQFREYERELDAALDAAVRRLPDPLRLAFVLRVLEGRAYDEVAQVAGVQPATARTHVAEARARLERWLAPWLRVSS